MTPITERQLRSFSGAMLELYRTASLDTLSQDFVAAISSVIKADHYSINWLASRRDRMLSRRLHDSSGPTETLRVRNWFRYPDYPREADITVFNRFMHQHPLFSHWETHGPSCAKWSDFLTLRELREKAIHREYFRHAGVNFQIGTLSTNPEGADVAIACNRHSRDFTEGDKQLLTLMAPHFEQAMKLAAGRAALSQVCSYERIAAAVGAVMIVNDAGVVLFRNAKAEALCEKFLPKSEGVPATIRHWIAGGFQRPLSARRAEEMLFIACEVAQPAEPAGRDLGVENNGAPGGTIYLLRLSERSSAPLEVALQSLGLTPREAEVLSWMARGKRNAEIAIILGMRTATVAKHAEHIFEKLQVENRTGAIALAWETVGA